MTAAVKRNEHGGMTMNIIQDLIPVGRRNRPGRSNPMKYITIHNTGNTGKGAGAKNHAAYVKSETAANAPVSWHYTVDDNDIYQHIPDNEDAFHAGDGTGDGNRKSIGIEICMNSDGDLLKATDRAAELAAFLCGKYDIPVENVVQHNHWSGKNCPQMLRQGKPYNWDTFIGKVKASLNPQPVEMDVTAALAVLVKHGVVNSPDYWLANHAKLAYVDKLIISMATKLTSQK
jgi:N-acetylmuramoyl-L-alanine amidase